MGSARELVSGGFDDDDLHAWRVGNALMAAVARLLLIRWTPLTARGFIDLSISPIGTDLPDAQSQLAYKRLEIALNASRSVP
jgi:hypothetical protein